jgi:hypothetical protein
MAREPRDEQTLVRHPGMDQASLPQSSDETAVRGLAEVTLVRPGVGQPTPPEPRKAIPFGQGYRLRARYELDEMIGQGAMGQVWRA